MIIYSVGDNLLPTEALSPMEPNISILRKIQFDNRILLLSQREGVMQT